MPYLVLTLLTCCSLCFVKPKNTLRKGYEYQYVFLFLLVIVFTVFYGIRYNVGIDYMTYYRVAQNRLYDVPLKGKGELFEPAFRLLYRIADFFCLPANTIFLFGGFIMYLFLFYGIHQYSENMALSFFIFFASGMFFFSLNEFRQFIAVCIVFAGYGYCVSRLFFRWCAMIFLGYLFHHSALIAFPMYFLYAIPLRRCFVNMLIIMSLVLKKIGVLEALCLLLSYIPGHFSNYATVLLYMITEGSSGIIGYAYLVMIAVMTNCGWFVRMNKEELFFFKVFIFASFFQNIFYNVYMVGRLMEYFSISLLVIYPAFCTRSKKSKAFYIFFLMISVLFFLNLWKYMFFPPEDSRLHYQTVFSR